MNLREMDERFDAYCERNLGEAGSGSREGLPPEWRGKRPRRVEREVDFDLETETAVVFAERHLGHPSPKAVDVKRVEGGAAALLLRDMWSQDVMVIVRGGEVLRWGSASIFHEMEEDLG